MKDEAVHTLISASLWIEQDASFEQDGILKLCDSVGGIVLIEREEIPGLIDALSNIETEQQYTGISRAQFEQIVATRGWTVKERSLEILYRGFDRPSQETFLSVMDGKTVLAEYNQKTLAWVTESQAEQELERLRGQL